MDDEKKAPPSTGAAQQRVVYSTTEGRQRFPDILQTSFGEKSVIGFDRYGRALGAIVPMEAVRILAGWNYAVDEDIKLRIQRTAESLLMQMPSEAALQQEPSVGSQQTYEIADVQAERKKAKRTARVRTGTHRAQR